MSHSVAQNWASAPIGNYFWRRIRTLFTGVPPVCCWVAFCSHKGLVRLLHFNARMSHLLWSWPVNSQALGWFSSLLGDACGPCQSYSAAWNSLPTQYVLIGQWWKINGSSFSLPFKKKKKSLKTMPMLVLTSRKLHTWVLSSRWLYASVTLRDNTHLTPRLPGWMTKTFSFPP